MQGNAQGGRAARRPSCSPSDVGEYVKADLLLFFFIQSSPQRALDHLFRKVRGPDKIYNSRLCPMRQSFLG